LPAQPLTLLFNSNGNIKQMGFIEHLADHPMAHMLIALIHHPALIAGQRIHIQLATPGVGKGLLLERQHALNILCLHRAKLDFSHSFVPAITSAPDTCCAKYRASIKVVAEYLPNWANSTIAHLPQTVVRHIIVRSAHQRWQSALPVHRATKYTRWAQRPTPQLISHVHSYAPLLHFAPALSCPTVTVANG